MNLLEPSERQWRFLYDFGWEHIDMKQLKQELSAEWVKNVYKAAALIRKPMLFSMNDDTLSSSDNVRVLSDTRSKHLYQRAEQQWAFRTAGCDLLADSVLGPKCVANARVTVVRSSLFVPSSVE